MDSPKCPTCGRVMCEQFDYERINAVAERAVPNGEFRCYLCEPITVVELFRGDWLGHVEVR